MKRKCTILISFDEDEGLYCSEVLELPGCESKSSSVERLLTRTEESIKDYVKIYQIHFIPMSFMVFSFLKFSML